MQWWMWVGVGIAALVGESASMALFLLYAGVAAFVAALLAYLGVPPIAQTSVFIILSALLIALVRPWMLHILVARVPQRLLTNQGNLMDRVATVVQTVTPHSGQVRVGNAEFWTARANPPTPRIETGCEVRIVYVSGLTAYVEPFPTAEMVEAPPAPDASTAYPMAQKEN